MKNNAIWIFIDSRVFCFCVVRKALKLDSSVEKTEIQDVMD